MKSLPDANSNFVEELNEMLNQPFSETMVSDEEAELFYFEDQALDPITNQLVKPINGEKDDK